MSKNSNPGLTLVILVLLMAGAYFFIIKPIQDTQTSSPYPNQCTSWYDGCNTCQIIDGKLGTCTKINCVRQGQEKCVVFSNNKCNPVWSDTRYNDFTFCSMEEAIKRASEINCTGYHKHDKVWMSCTNHTQLDKVVLGGTYG